MSNHIETLLELCKEQPFDTEKIQNYITTNKMNSEQITQTAIKLCEYGMWSYSNYLSENRKEPLPEELRTYNWESLFNILLENGLDANLVIENGRFNFANVLYELQYFDDRYLGAKIARNILSNGTNPNIVIDSCPLFKEIDEDFMIDIQLDLYHHKWQLDNAFRYWLVLAAFGGVIRDGLPPIEMCGDFKIDVFKDFEKFDYNIKWGDKDFDLEIFDKETGIIVGIA